MLKYTRILLDDLICQLSHWKNRSEFKQLRKKTGDYSLKGFDELECIFVHIPKAAGISVNIALFGNYGGGHQTVRGYKRIFGPIVYRRYFSFTFVRNPYERLVSAWNFLNHGGFKNNEHNWAKKHLSGFTSFDEFVREWLNEKTIWSINHFKPQYSFVCDINLTPEVDFIGRVETIEKDFDYVCNKLKIENKLSLHNPGKSDNSNWHDYYTPDSLAKVYKLYKYDFEIFGYDGLT
jgi:hypothetical protein